MPDYQVQPDKPQPTANMGRKTKAKAAKKKNEKAKAAKAAAGEFSIDEFAATRGAGTFRRLERPERGKFILASLGILSCGEWAGVAVAGMHAYWQNH